MERELLLLSYGSQSSHYNYKGEDALGTIINPKYSKLNESAVFKTRGNEWYLHPNSSTGEPTVTNSREGNQSTEEEKTNTIS